MCGLGTVNMLPLQKHNVWSWYCQHVTITETQRVVLVLSTYYHTTNITCGRANDDITQRIELLTYLTLQMLQVSPSTKGAHKQPVLWLQNIVPDLEHWPHLSGLPSFTTLVSTSGSTDDMRRFI